MHYTELKFAKRSKFLITGVAGFIGSNIAEALLNMGYNVRGLDDFSNGKKENLKTLRVFESFEFIEGDIVDFDTCMQACKGVDFISHQAAWGSVPRSIEMPLFYETVNVKGTLNMLEAAKQNNVKKFIYASSSSVYGDEPNLPKVEGREGNLISPYALTKKINEEYAKIYSDIYGLDTYGLRYFNVFGKRQDPNGAYAAVIPKFIQLLMNDEQPIINGDGTHSRDFTYIENVIDANLKAMKADRKYSGQAFNIAFGGRVNLNELYKTISEALNSNLKPIYGPERAGDIKHSNADITKAKQLINYSPEASFFDGMKLTIDYFLGLIRND